jgi:hypothetical protein
MKLFKSIFIFISIFFSSAFSIIYAQLEQDEKAILTDYYTNEFLGSYYNTDGKLGDRLNKIFNDPENEKSLRQCLEGIKIISIYVDINQK